jgi:threonine/homoserine/homoserine lactone efflux protein
MELAILILYGFGLSFIGVLPPGIININTAIISAEKGTFRGVVFALGACFVVLFQVLIAIIIAKNITMEASVVLSINKAAVFIFIALAAYFYFCAKKPPKRKAIGKDSNIHFFLKGAFFSAINFFPIPYYLTWSKALNERGEFEFTPLYISVFILTVILGTFVANYIYIISFKRFQGSPDKFAKNANYVLAGITLALAIYALVDINL